MQGLVVQIENVHVVEILDVVQGMSEPGPVRKLAFSKQFYKLWKCLVVLVRSD